MSNNTGGVGLMAVVNGINAIGASAQAAAAQITAAVDSVVAAKAATAPGAITTGTVTSGPNDTLTRLINGLANYPGGKP
jgi:hypothetical protein